MIVPATPPWLLAAAQPGAGALTQLFLASGAMIVLICVLAMWRKRLRERLGDSAPRAKSDKPSRPAPSVKAQDLQQLLSDADELAHRLASHLDAKAARLQTLIAEADTRIARLERAAGASARSSQRHALSGPSQFAESRPRRDPLAASAIDPVSREVYRLADDGLPSIEIAQALDEQVGKVELILALREG